MHLEINAGLIGLIVSLATVLLAAAVRLEMSVREVKRALDTLHEEGARIRALELGHAVHEQRIVALEGDVESLRKRSHSLANGLTKIEAVCQVQHSSPPPSD